MKKSFLFRFRFKFKPNDKWIPSAWETYDEREAEVMAEAYRNDPLSQVFCYDLNQPI